MKEYPIRLSQPKVIELAPDNPRKAGIGSGALIEVKDALAAGAGRIMAMWSSVDIEILRLASMLVGGRFGPVSEMLLAVTDRYKMARALAQAARASGRSEDDVTLVERVMTEVNRIGERRNEYAHDVWVQSDEYPDMLLLATKPDVARSFARNKDKEPTTAVAARGFTLAHLQDDFDAMADAYELVSLLSLVLSDGREADQARLDLSQSLPTRKRDRKGQERPSRWPLRPPPERPRPPR